MVVEDVGVVAATVVEAGGRLLTVLGLELVDELVDSGEHRGPALALLLVLTDEVELVEVELGQEREDLTHPARVVPLDREVVVLHVVGVLHRAVGGRLTAGVVRSEGVAQRGRPPDQAGAGEGRNRRGAVGLGAVTTGVERRGPFIGGHDLLGLGGHAAEDQQDQGGEDAAPDGDVDRQQR